MLRFSERLPTLLALSNMCSYGLSWSGRQQRKVSRSACPQCLQQQAAAVAVAAAAAAAAAAAQRTSDNDGRGRLPCSCSDIQLCLPLEKMHMCKSNNIMNSYFLKLQEGLDNSERGHTEFLGCVACDYRACAGQRAACCHPGGTQYTNFRQVGQAGFTSKHSLGPFVAPLGQRPRPTSLKA